MRPRKLCNPVAKQGMRGCPPFQKSETPRIFGGVSNSPLNASDFPRDCQRIEHTAHLSCRSIGNSINFFTVELLVARHPTPNRPIWLNCQQSGLEQPMQVHPQQDPVNGGVLVAPSPASPQVGSFKDLGLPAPRDRAAANPGFKEPKVLEATHLGGRGAWRNQNTAVDGILLRCSPASSSMVPFMW